MWNGVGPGFLKRTPGTFAHRRDGRCGFEWDHRAGARPRPTTPELRLADLDRDGLDAEVVYGCLMINDMIADRRAARVGQRASTTTGPPTSRRRSDPNRIYPLAIVPNNDPQVAAAEVRRCAKMGLQGRRPRVQAMSIPLYQHELVPALGGGRRVPLPDRVPLHRLQGGARPRHPRDGAAVHAPVAPGALLALPARHHGGAGLDHHLRGVREVPRLQVRPGRSGVTWLPYVFDRLDTE